MQFNHKIKNRLILILLLVAIIPMAVTTIINIFELDSTLSQDVKNELESQLETKTDEIVETLSDVEKDMSLINWTRNNFTIDQQNAAAGAQGDALKESIQQFLTQVASTLNFKLMLISDTQTGDISYSYGLKNEQIKKLLDEPAIRQAAGEALKDGKTKYTDFISSDATGSDHMFMTVPTGSKANKNEILLVGFDNYIIDHIINEGLSKTFTQKIYILDSTGKIVASTANAQSADGIFEAHEQMEAAGSKTLNQGNNFYIHLDFGEKIGLDWFMIAQFDTDAIREEIDAMIYNNAKLGLIMCVLVIIAAVLISNNFAKPISDLTDKFQIMAGGDLTVEKIKVTHKNEIGKLMQAYNDMLDGFRTQVTTQQKTSAELASALSQISATISQLSTNSAETSSAISEISTTMEEVKQTSQVASDKAIDVANKSKQVDNISKDGFNATMKTIDGISNIKEEMTILADSIVKLSNQSQSIAEIIDAVSNIAEQSNLLSVNAAIEAAKAGEFGKGFSVVAQEVKSLAEQSKTSTKQVRQILDEIQKATADAVMATERGAKAVDSGVELSQSTGSAIRTLEENITESARAASQISASSKQQLVGIEQLAVALQNIKEATDQNLEGIMQLEEAATSIRQLGEKVKELTSEFKV